MRSSKMRSHRFMLAFFLLLSASALFVAASSASNNRPLLGDPNEVYDSRHILLHNAKIDTRLSPQFHQEPHLLANSNTEQGNSINQYLVQVDERLSESQRKAIEDTLGAPLVKYFPHNTWHILTTPTTARALQSLGGVHWVGHYHPKYKLHINVIEGNHNLKLAKYKPVMARFLEASASNMSSADKKLLAHHFSHLSASSVHPEGTILGKNPFELYAVLPKWNDDMGQVENVAAAFTERLQKDHAELSERVKFSAGSGDLIEASCKNEADLQAIADFMSAQSETFIVTRKSIQRVHNRWARGVSQSDIGNPTYTGTPAATQSVSQQRGLFGQGQVIGVSDSGLDWQSCFFHDTAFPTGPTFYNLNQQIATAAAPTAASVNANHRKVIQYVAWADRLDENGHGTHVAGSVAGKLYTANNAYAPVNGMSQEAKLAFYDIGIGTAGSLTVPNNYDRTLFPWAKVAGAAIHSNSWGSADNTYSIDAAWTDNYMWLNKEFLILVAAGNDGNQPNTVGAPATAKNIVTVGAGTNSKEGWEGMFCATGYNLNTGLCNVGRQFPGSFDKQHIAGFSSVGPTRDGRLKPEVVAPGMFILSARNRQTASTSCTSAVGALTTFNAGTSMATPVTAGDVGIIRQWFTEGYYPSGLKNAADGFVPSASLMKAMLISGSRMLDRYGGTVDSAGFLFANGVAQPNAVPLVAAPGMVQGYGRVEIDNSIYFQGSTHKSIVLGLGAVAGGQRAEPRFTAAGTQTYKMCIQSVSLATPVRIALVWTDYPGQTNAANPLVNNLDLSVAARGSTYLGNSKANTAGGTADIRNPSEVVSFDERSAFPAKTDITITVTATRIAQGPQPYTLLATGDVTEGECAAATAAPAETFVWVAPNFGTCSAECAKTGEALPTRTRIVRCVGSINGPTTDDKCANSGPKPATIENCNTQPCGATTYEYVVGAWSACSKTCGGGTQTRTVECRSIQTGTVVDEKNCGDHTKPASIQNCNTQQCIGSTSSPTSGAEWRVGDCTTCSTQCTCTRDVSCYYYGNKVADYLCAPENGGPTVKPPATVACTGGQCQTTGGTTNAPTETFSWTASDWGACSVGCTKEGSTGGIQTRTIKCRSSMGYDTADNRCASTARPAAASACNLDPCPDVSAGTRAVDYNHQWLMGGWGRCDAVTKTQSRWVICATTNGDNVDAAKCEGHAGPKPAASRACTPLTPYDSMSVAQRDANVAYTWYTERWGDPSTWCGGNGRIFRYAWCLGTDGKVADTRARCDSATKPLEEDKCLACDRPCVAQPRWVPGEYWMGCSTIDPCCGTEHRHAFCIGPNGQKIADTTACGGNGTAQEYFYQTPCVSCPNNDKTKCGQFPQGLYPDRGDGPALPGSKVPGTPAMPAGGPLAVSTSTTAAPATTARPGTQMTYVRMQANGLILRGELTTEAGLKAFLVARIAAYLNVAINSLQVTYFSKTGPDTNARVVIIVGVAQNSAKALVSDQNGLTSAFDGIEFQASETTNPTEDVPPATDDSSTMSSDTMKIAIGAGVAVVALLLIIGGIYVWQKQKANAVKHTARMGPEIAMTN